MHRPEKRIHKHDVSISTRNSGPGHPHILGVPRDIAVSILLFIRITDLCVYRAVSKEFRAVSISAIKLTKRAKLQFFDEYPDYEQRPLNLLATYCTKLTCLILENRSFAPERTCRALRPVLLRNPNVKIWAGFVDDQITRLLCELNIEVEELRTNFFWENLSCFSESLKRCLVDSQLCNTQWSRLQQCRKLEALSVKRVSDGIINQFVNCPNLVSLRILDCIYNRFRALPHVTEFAVHKISTSHNDGMRNIVRSLPNLRTLQIFSDLVTSDLRLLSDLKNLQAVYITINGGLEEALGALAHVKMLKLCGSEEYDMMDAFRRLTMAKKDTSWEWLHFVSKSLKGTVDGWSDIRKVGTMSSNLAVLKVNGSYVIGSKVTEPKWDVVALWVEFHFANKLEDG